MNKVRKLEWDSNYFGFNVAKLEGSNIDSKELQSIIHAAKNEQIRLIYWFVEPTDLLSIETSSLYNFQLIDNKIVLQRIISENDAFEKDINIMSFLGRPITPALRALSIQAGMYSRFKRDAKFGLSKFEDLYNSWLINSLNGKLSNEVFVYVRNSKELGFITLKDESNTSTIGLIAVDEQWRGQGIGKKLLLGAFARCVDLKAQAINVTTQNANREALDFYQKFGFNIIQSTLIYHIWIK